MNGFGNLVMRNCKLFFRDKGLFFTAMITPMILLLLFTTFLRDVYRDMIVAGMPEAADIPDKLINGIVGGELISSLIAVSCVTVAFFSNFLMVQDKVNGSRRDLLVTPVKKPVLALSYYVSTAISTMIVCVVTTAVGLAYLAKVGWYLSKTDILLLLLDVFLLVMFGTALSSIINLFLTSQGQISAVGAIVSAGYGFICGAYMPISNFSEGLQKTLSLLPGTYGTSLVRNHCLRGAFEELSGLGVPAEFVEKLKDVIDCNLYFGGEKVGTGAMYVILVTAVAVLIGIYILLNIVMKKRAAQS